MARLIMLGYAQMMDEEPTHATLEAEFPGWHFWTGVTGRANARKLGSLPVVLLDGEDWADLRGKVAAYETLHGGIHG